MTNIIFVLACLFVVLILMAMTDKTLRVGENVQMEERHFPEEKGITPMHYGIWLLMTGRNKYNNRKRKQYESR